jgi:hypothetical protein
MGGFRHTRCEHCGKGFMDDCGDAFCSASCERAYERENKQCDNCGDEVGADNLNIHDLCERCVEDEQEEESE